MIAELKKLYRIIKSLDKKVIIIFLSVAVLQTISWYYTSRRFFRATWFEDLQFERDVYLWEYLYWFAGDIFTLFVIPALIIKLWFREKLGSYGVAAGDYKAGVKYSIIFLAIMLPVIWVVSSSGEFADAYPMLYDAKLSLRVFLIFETGLVFYIAAWEFIWRGFMLFGLKEKFGYYSVFIQMIPFLILHNGKPAVEAFSAILGGIALGILALRTGSVLYGIFIHAGIMFTIDFISVLRFKAQDFGAGLSSVINILKQLF
jgi:membrane protease YdiL (CAAX protease family)